MKKIISTFLLSASLCITFNSKAAAAATDLPVLAFKEDCQKTVQNQNLLKKLPAQYYLSEGILCSESNSFQKTIALLNKSASYNYSPANYALAVYYENKYENGNFLYGSKGQPSDLISAINNYKKVAAEGSVLAENRLGEIYLAEAVLPIEDRAPRDIANYKAPIMLPDIDKAVYWLTKAAQDGDPSAQGTLGELYKQGIGVAQNLVQAYAWQSIAVTSQTRFNPDFTNNAIPGDFLKVNQDERDKLYTKLTAQQKNEAQKLVEQYSVQYIKAPNKLDIFCRNTEKMILLPGILKNLKTIADSIPASSQ